MLAPVLEATDLARVVLPTPGKPQKRIISGITNAMASAYSLENSIQPQL
jgi:hypothetical protein